MKSNALSLFSVIVLCLVTASSEGRADAPSCKDLAGLSLSALPDAPTQITGTRFVAAADGLPAYCEVIGYTAPQVGLHIRLPEQWSGRFHMEGCGTMCGVRIIENADDPLSRGTAVATTDMGRSAPVATAEWTGDRPDYNTIMRSGEWAYNNTEQELDFAYRGTHKAVLASKAIVAAYYGAGIDYAYWRGCSTGGRQGLMLAQRFPWHFDGIVAGAPAGIQPAYINIFWRTLTNIAEDGRAILGQSQIPAVHDEVMKQCDSSDGLVDGVIDDPFACAPNLSVLKCADGASSNQCLSDDQIAVVERLYNGAFLSEGLRVSWGVPKGGELGLMRYILIEAGEVGTFEPMAQDRLRYTWFDYDPGPTYDARTFDLDRDYPRLFTRGFLPAPNNPDVTDFKRRGGKLITYQGLNDMLNAEPLIEYVKKVERVVGGEKEADEFLRLYLVPGMNHCRGGPGVDTFDWVSEIQAWVEEDKAPGTVIGYRRDGDISMPGAKAWPPIARTVTKTRPVYDYPYSARYTGQGDVTDAANFEPKPLSFRAQP
ncbi:MAG: tannase/feruloyl esterase family alpha/beta hydrolase [Rhodospirillaceae bacterium]|nr:tannase/feruloyl esterase family alpha/beta hydrolase [Rhodospirillaceae bacterium]